MRDICFFSAQPYSVTTIACSNKNDWHEKFLLSRSVSDNNNNNNNNNNNTNDNVYGAVIMTQSLREFTRFLLPGNMLPSTYMLTATCCL